MSTAKWQNIAGSKKIFNENGIFGPFSQCGAKA
jgi:hypothetical protein